MKKIIYHDLVEICHSSRWYLSIVNYELWVWIMNYEIKKKRGCITFLMLVDKYQNKKMKENNIIQQKTFYFAVNIVKVCKYLKEKKKEIVIANQLLRAGTAVGANVEEAIGCQSKKDFYFRMKIAYKEARESIYWLKLAKESRIIQPEMVDPCISECDEILRIIGTILKTLRNHHSPHNS